MNPNRDDIEVDWTPNWEWLAAVAAIHVLAVVPWMAHLGLWPLVPCALSALHHWRIFRRDETWRFALVEESVVLFEPERPGTGRRPAKLRGPPWMTEHWIVVRTSRRVLALRAGRYPPALFARLRRALLHQAGRSPRAG